MNYDLLRTNCLTEVCTKIADELELDIETVRNYFGGHNYKYGSSVGIHIEPGPDGGIVVLDDTTIFDKALEILGLSDYPETPVEKDRV